MKIHNEKKRISVIVPVYKGKKYIDSVIRMIERNSSDGYEVELIFVNDYPDETIQIINDNNLIDIRLLVNEENKGIHYSRVKGLKAATGDYVMFLDQDDTITDDCLLSQLKSIKKYDVVVSNGYVELKQGYKHLYKYYLMHATVKYSFFYWMFHDRIISPGQCLIKKKSIPEAWCRHICKYNSRDDFFLWILMFVNGCRFGINRKYLYTHRYTGENASLNMEELDKSKTELVEMLGDDIPAEYHRFMERLMKPKHGIINKLVKVGEKLNKNSK